MSTWAKVKVGSLMAASFGSSSRMNSSRPMKLAWGWVPPRYLSRLKFAAVIRVDLKRCGVDQHLLEWVHQLHAVGIRPSF